MYLFLDAYINVSMGKLEGWKSHAFSRFLYFLFFHSILIFFSSSSSSPTYFCASYPTSDILISNSTLSARIKPLSVSSISSCYFSSPPQPLIRTSSSLDFTFIYSNSSGTLTPRPNSIFIRNL